MRTATATVEVQRGGVQSENTFTIKATSKAFDILSSGLYSDKIKAIVRELSCNAYDSHVAAGKADLPIEVKLPSRFDLTFYVKDFGLGLSHEGVTQLYTTYFESTKTDSDDYIGQLGLGSKSPFSYASAFTVESRFEGTRRVYTCFKNEQGLPSISLMGEEATDEPNGVTVSLAVKRDDVDKFSEAARKAFMYFNPKPVIKGDNDWSPYRLNHTIAGANWKIRETDSYARMEKAYVVQGFVPYPVDADILSERGMSYAANKVANTNIDLYVDIGQVEVAASREALSYDERTIQNLIDVLESAAKEMRISFQKEFDACTCQWEVAQLVGKFKYSASYEFREIYNSMHTTVPFTWNGSPVTHLVELDLTDIQHTTIRRITNSGRRPSIEGTWSPDSAKKKMAYDVSQHNMYVLVTDEAKAHVQLAEHFFDTLSYANVGRSTLLVIAPTSKKLYNQKEVDLIVKQFGAPEVTNSSDLNFTRTKTSTYKKRMKEEKLVWKGFPEYKDHRGRTQKRSTYSRLCWTTESIDLEEGGVYVNIERFTPIGNGLHMLSAAHALGLVDEDFKVFGMNERDRKHIQGNEDWVELSDFLQEKFNALNANDALFKRAVIDSVLNQIGYNIKRVFVDDWSKMQSMLKPGQFAEYFEKISTLNSEAAVVPSDAVRIMVTNLYPTVDLVAKADDVYKEWINLVKKYGMLSMINWGWVDSSNISSVVDYINVMEH